MPSWPNAALTKWRDGSPSVQCDTRTCPLILQRFPFPNSRSGAVQWSGPGLTTIVMAVCPSILGILLRSAQCGAEDRKVPDSGMLFVAARQACSQ